MKSNFVRTIEITFPVWQLGKLQRRTPIHSRSRHASGNGYFWNFIAAAVASWAVAMPNEIAKAINTCPDYFRIMR